MRGYAIPARRTRPGRSRSHPPLRITAAQPVLPPRGMAKLLCLHPSHPQDPTPTLAGTHPAPDAHPTPDTAHPPPGAAPYTPRAVPPPDLTWPAAVRPVVVWPAVVWPAVVWPAVVWPVVVWSVVVWPAVVWPAAVWSGRSWSGRSWSGRSWSGRLMRCLHRVPLRRGLCGLRVCTPTAAGAGRGRKAGRCSSGCRRSSRALRARHLLKSPARAAGRGLSVVPPGIFDRKGIAFRDGSRRFVRATCRDLANRRGPVNPVINNGNRLNDPNPVRNIAIKTPAVAPQDDHVSQIVVERAGQQRFATRDRLSVAEGYQRVARRQRWPAATRRLLAPLSKPHGP
ncbi:hypothetical protein J2S43_002839 [Catenuloplanes nepalensis]|uniref:Uncharacterized protein n=1 Tax=Catenuloplanes nepalensis TaxID=587533 RepID=A0ABT9MSC4_9ACTN|nr:hypothetical protein [Catenuloplanes nepalensis]